MRSSLSSIAKIGFLVPASKQSGLGHYFRALPYQRQIPKSIFLSEGELITSLSPGAVRLPDPHDASAFVEAIAALNLKFLYVDHFLLSAPVKSALQSQKNFPVSYFDGKFENPAFSALVNTNPYASESSYGAQAPGTKYFLGAGFHLFREELEAVAGAKKEKRCFVCFGGTDAMNLTERAVRELPPGIPYSIVLGPGAGFSTQEAVKAALKDTGLDARLFCDPDNYFTLMAGCDRAVLSCSTIVYEALRLGLRVACFQFVDNQDILGDYLRSNELDVRDIRRTGADFKNLDFRGLELKFGERSQELIDYIKGFL